MPDLTNDFNVVELLREKTGETDLKQCLKSTLGGFSKRSVMNYLTLLRAQQQATAETFDQNIKSLLAEKEKLKSENEELRAKHLKLDTEYKNLSESILQHDFENGGYKPQDIANFKGTIEALENEAGKLNKKIAELAGANEELKETIRGSEAEQKQSWREAEAQKALYLTEKNESKKLRDKILELLAVIEVQQSEIKRIKNDVSEKRIMELTANVNELMAEINAQTEIIESCNENIFSKEQEITILTEQNESLRRNISSISSALENTTEQNEKLLFINKSLSDSLKEEYRKAIETINVKSDVVIDKLNVMRKLDEANSKIAALELRLDKYTVSEEKKKIAERAI